MVDEVGNSTRSYDVLYSLGRNLFKRRTMAGLVKLNEALELLGLMDEGSERGT